MRRIVELARKDGDVHVSGPVLLRPQLDPKPWGGHTLARFGFDLPPDEPIGEALLTGSGAVVAVGSLAGQTLGEIVSSDPEMFSGHQGLAVTGGHPFFPILIKLIDAQQHLSIQVHPTDATAPAGSLGKTEAWHILAADPGAELFLGLKEGVSVADIAELARAGVSTADLMRAVPARPGDTFFIPAGTVHALGAGVLIYEIQQPSGITYRLDDWGRRDAEGKGRELHIEQGLAVLDPASRPEALARAALPTNAGIRTRLVSCDYFSAEHLILARGEAMYFRVIGAPQAFTVLNGSIVLIADGQEVAAKTGDTAVLFADAGPVAVTAEVDAMVIRGLVGPGQD